MASFAEGQRPLGRVVRIDPRGVWHHEAQAFTPWLEEHIDELSERLGVELEIEAREAPVGPFSADLYGRDATTGAQVVIENQLDQTDHSHLGQLLTYAAGLDAKTLVWIATEIRDEHRQAIDWLNTATTEEFAFFAVRVELLSIGDELAPDFVIVASPNAWQKQLRAVAGAARTSSGRGEKYRAIWNLFLQRLKEADPNVTRATIAPATNWINIAGYPLAFSTRGPRVEIYLDSPLYDDPKAVFDRLHEMRSEIEQALGHELSWERLDDKRAARIALYTSGDWTAEGQELDKIVDWLVATLLQFRSVVPPFIAQARATPPASGGLGPVSESSSSDVFNVEGDPQV